jgi:hypothetical protein
MSTVPRSIQLSPLWRCGSRGLVGPGHYAVATAHAGGSGPHALRQRGGGPTWGCATGISLGPEGGGFCEYDYDEALDEYDGISKPRVFNCAGAVYACDHALTLADEREPRAKGAIYDRRLCQDVRMGDGYSIPQAGRCTLLWRGR